MSHTRRSLMLCRICYFGLLHEHFDCVAVSQTYHVNTGGQAVGVNTCAVHAVYLGAFGSDYAAAEHVYLCLFAFYGLNT